MKSECLNLRFKPQKEIKNFREEEGVEKPRKIKEQGCHFQYLFGQRDDQ